MNANIQDYTCNDHQNDHQDVTQQDANSMQSTNGNSLLPNSTMSLPTMDASNYDDLLSFALAESGLTTSFSQDQFDYPQDHNDDDSIVNSYHQLTYQDTTNFYHRHDTELTYQDNTNFYHHDTDNQYYLDDINNAIQLQADQTSQDYHRQIHDNYHGHSVVQPSSFTGTMTPDSANRDTSLIANIALPPLPLSATEFVQNLVKPSYTRYPFYTR